MHRTVYAELHDGAGERGVRFNMGFNVVLSYVGLQIQAHQLMGQPGLTLD